MLTQALFRFDYLRETPEGRVVGNYVWMQIPPHSAEKARMFDRAEELKDACR